jgi:Ycf66 protein N-terminus
VGTGLNTPALLFGIILLVASIGLFFWGRLKPELARDADNVYSVIGIICSVILFTSAFDLSLILGFQQLLLIGSVIALMWENIRVRTPNLDARSSGSSFPGSKRDDDRGSSRRPYRAERANEYEEFGASPGRGSAGLEGGRRDRDGYGDGGYSGSGGFDGGGRSLPRREGRDDRPSNDRPSNDRSSNDRPTRRNSGDDDFARGRDDGFNNEPRSIPERSSRPARDSNEGRSNEGRSNEGRSSSDSSDRPRRRRSSNEETDRPRRRSSQVEDVRGNNDDIPAADYADFTPLEIKPEKPAGSSWGPGS